MKKKLLTIAFAIIAAPILLTSCDIISGGPALNSEGGIEKLKAKIEKNVDAEALIYHISFNPEDEFSYKVQMIHVYHSEPGSDEVKCTSIYYSPTSMVKETEPGFYKNRKPESGIALKDLDFSQIPANLNKAASYLSENDIKVSGTGLYRYNVEAPNVDHSFTLHQKGKTTTVGNRQQIEYFKYDFVADNEGNVEYKE